MTQHYRLYVPLLFLTAVLLLFCTTPALAELKTDQSNAEALDSKSLGSHGASASPMSDPTPRCENSVVTDESKAQQLAQNCLGQGDTCTLFGTPCCPGFNCRGNFPNTTCQPAK